MSPKITAYGGSPQGQDIDVARFILETTSAPWVPGEVVSSLTGWMEGTPQALTSTARTVLEGAASGSTIVTTAPGPLTLAMAARAAAHPAYRTHLALDALVSWIARHRADVESVRDDVEMLVVLDEPALAAFAPDAGDVDRYRQVAVSTLTAIVDRSPLPIVIRASEDTDWSVVAEAAPAFVGWNVTELGFGFDQHIDEVAKAIGNGMGVMWGVASVEPAPQGSDDVTLNRYRTAFAKLIVAGAPIRAIREDAWFVPNGSMERLGVDRARRVMGTVREIAEEADD